jgi:CDP-diacylglycerol--serine O-phosphatidyltransferase
MKLRLFTLPNAVTCLNLVAGCVAVERAFAFDFAGAFLFVAIAAVLDFLDGFAARLLKSYSEVGKQLDSLADAVSFGAAPAFALFNLLRSGGFTGPEVYLVFVVAAFSALRLAKFNLDRRQSDGFIGLPTPANALLIVSLVFQAGRAESGPLSGLLDTPWTLIGLSVVLSLLLVGEIPMFSLKFKTFGWRGNAIRYLFLAASLALLLIFRIAAVPMIVGGYIAFSLIRALLQRRVN